MFMLIRFQEFKKDEFDESNLIKKTPKNIFLKLFLASPFSLYLVYSFVYILCWFICVLFGISGFEIRSFQLSSQKLKQWPHVLDFCRYIVKVTQKPYVID